MQEYEKNFESKALSLDKLLARYKEIAEEGLARISKSNTVLGTAATYALSAGGKRVRPIVTLLMCEAYSGACEAAVPVAVAYELAHSASLAQDDVIDESPLRHDKQSVPKKYGLVNAMLTSDVLLFKTFESFSAYGKARISKATLAKLLEVFSKAAVNTVEGEYLEMSLTNRTDVSEREYVNVAGLKTGSLFAACAASGALVGRARKKAVDLMYEFGYNLGVSFQMRDDILDVLGNTEETGKPIMKDLQNNATNVVVIDALEHADPRRRHFISSMMFRKWYGFNEVRALVECLQDLGSIDRAVEMTRVHASKAREMLAIVPQGEARDKLDSLTRALEARRE